MLDFVGVRRHEQNASGREALKRAYKMSRLDLILMDLNLPDQSGYEILNKLRQNPRLVDTCVIAVTADTNTATMEKARRAGFDGFLGKPVDPDRFSNLLTDILNGEAIWDLGDVRW
jgi:two-component system cell cycle response regulator DivK